jgi:hypothetical protein
VAGQPEDEHAGGEIAAVDAGAGTSGYRIGRCGPGRFNHDRQSTRPARSMSIDRGDTQTAPISSSRGLASAE